MNVTIPVALQNWIPYQLFFEEGKAFARWLFIGNENFTEPFFDETIAKCKWTGHNSQSLKCISDMEILPEWSKDIESVEPSAFIFHVSRCGSTLASQLLALNPAHIVLSEVPFFDELLRWKNKTPGANEEELLRLLQSAITFYAAKRNADADHLFIKTDSWHIFFYPLIRKLYPRTPFILLYRRPDEVIRSQQKRRGMQSVPGLIEPALFGFDKNEIQNIPLDEYMTKVLEKYFGAFLQILGKDALAFPINYKQGAVEMVKTIATVTSASISDNDMAKIKQRAAYHAKYPDQAFTEEPIQTTIPLYCKKAFELYEAVEKIRKSMPGYAE
ncbi:MAG: sulfotransferase family protein [Bacteroidota bacterium]|nr:sulfotransferase family protein [Bacteroidota bacterium]